MVNRANTDKQLWKSKVEDNFGGEVQEIEPGMLNHQATSSTLSETGSC